MIVYCTMSKTKTRKKEIQAAPPAVLYSTVISYITPLGNVSAPLRERGSEKQGEKLKKRDLKVGVRRAWRSCVVCAVRSFCLGVCGTWWVPYQNGTACTIGLSRIHECIFLYSR